MPSKPTFGVGVVRAAAQARADETSLHSTADEIGMSYTGLRHFLAGGKPHPKTLERLVAWHLERRHAEGGQEAIRADVATAVSFLVRYLRKSHGRVREDRTRRIIAEISKGAEAEVPE